MELIYNLLRASSTSAIIHLLCKYVTYYISNGTVVIINLKPIT